MTKEGVISAVAGDTEIAKAIVEDIINTALEVIQITVARGEKVKLRGFGTFEPQKRAPRTGRNSLTGEPIPIPGKVAPVFKPSDIFKETVAEFAQYGK